MTSGTQGPVGGDTASRSRLGSGAQPDTARLTRKPRSLTADAARRLVRSPSGIVGLSIVGVVLLVAITANWVAPYPPLKADATAALQGPNWQHLMGTDEIGRDILSRIIHGASLSLQVGFAATLVSVALGIVIGLLSGYAGGFVDGLIMRFTDIMLAIPSQLMALVIVSLLGPALTSVELAVGISAVPRFSRLVRATVLSAKQNVYVEAARTIGCRGRRIAFRHILPNVIGPTVVLATLYVSSAILLAAALSYLGMGAQPPVPEWGLMLARGRIYLRAAPWLTAFPGLAIMVTVLGVNMLGDALRDATDPRLTR